MAACSKIENHSAKHYRCPVNGKVYAAVGIRTILHHLQESWNKRLLEQGYYFCTDQDCDVVYFGDDDDIILKTQLRTRVGVKESRPDRTICYCFGVSFRVSQEDPAVIDFVREKTRQGLCSCETSNPSGRCCLKDFAKQ